MIPPLSTMRLPQKFGYLDYRHFCMEYEEELENIFGRLKSVDTHIFDKLSMEIFTKFIYKEYYIKL